MVCVWITNVKTFKDNHHLGAYNKDLQMNHIPNEIMHTFYQQVRHVLILLALKPQLNQHLQKGLKSTERTPLLQ